MPCPALRSALIATCALLCACETTQTTDRPPMPTETMRDVKSAHDPANGQVHEFPDDSAIAPDAAAQARVTTVLLPLDKGVDAAWAIVDEQSIPALTRGVWHANGLRIGLLPQQDLKNFLDAMPENWGDRQKRIIGGPTPTPLLQSRPLRANFYADLTVPPFAPKREDVTGHRMQLLMSMAPQPDGFTRVELTPQHHKPRQMLRARTALEKMLDGRMFEELAIRVDVADDRYLVLGLARDPRTLPPDQRPGAQEEIDRQPPQENNAPLATADTASGLQSNTPPTRDLVLQADNQPADAKPPKLPPAPMEPLPLNLGRALMTQAMPGGEAQVLLLIRIHPLR